MKPIPPEVMEYAECYMQSYEYSDNLRIANLSDPESVAQYEEQRRNGCCGSEDYIKFHWKGTEYWFGFNYGH